MRLPEFFSSSPMQRRVRSRVGELPVAKAPRAGDTYLDAGSINAMPFHYLREPNEPNG